MADINALLMQYLTKPRDVAAPFDYQTPVVPQEGKQNAANMALINTGLGMMAANRPGASLGETIGKGGLVGMQSYQTLIDKALKEKMLDEQMKRQAFHENLAVQGQNRLADTQVITAINSAIKNGRLNEVELLSLPDDDPRKKLFIEGKRSIQEPKASNEASILSLPDDDPRKKRYMGAKKDLRSSETKPPSGYRLNDSGDLEPIPGGPADTKRQNAMATAQSSLVNATEGLNRLGEAANALKNHPGLARITGIRGKIPNIPGTDAANAQALIDNLKSQAGFTVLQNMRDMSKTGGALGQVSDRENIMLQNNLAALDLSQDTKSFISNLDKIISYVETAKGNLKSGFDRNFYSGEKTSSTTANSAKSSRPPMTGAVWSEPYKAWFVRDKNSSSGWSRID